ncbi:hypothetical protein MicloDRAFT_00046100 [Microvirga lotononidis]|uniref:Phage integrase family protein n=2 Tax=Microvirga lotononidis TaxID=864069 RepID=I4YVP1_9HYPH|nr:hypothetical protein MicloDRAFT_00046100 [Microvirga lotononidis]
MARMAAARPDGRADSEGPTEAPWLLSPYWADTILVAGRFEPLPVHLKVPLPGGSLLTDSVNSHLNRTIRRVIFEQRTGPLATCEYGEHQVQTARSLITLVEWMLLNSIYRFADLTSDDISDYLEARIAGREHCIDAPNRISSVLREYETCPQTLPSFTEILQEASIDSKSRDLPASLERFNEFCVRHDLESRISKTLPKQPSEVISNATIRSEAARIASLWTLRSRIRGDRLTCNPFPDGIDATVGHLGRPGGRTRTIPMIQGDHLLTEAARLVLETGPIALDLRDAWTAHKRDYPHNYSRADGNAIFERANAALLQRFRATSVATTVSFKVAKGKISFRKLVDGFIPTACAILILTLMARRKREGLAIEVGAIQGSRADGWFVRMPILKTGQGTAVLPCPELVIKAVELLERWSEPARTKVDQRLFQVPGFTDHKEAREFRIGIHLGDFARAVGVPALEDGSFFDFAPHQFRRFWVVLFVWRYDGDLGAASWFLHHFNIDHTRRYANDAELGRMIHVESRHFTVTKVRAVAQGDSKSAGLLGRKLDKRIQRHMDEMRKRVRVVGEQELTRECERLVDQLKLELRASPWGLCGCRATEPARRRAKCLQDTWNGGALALDGRPDPSGSSESTCATCIHNMVDQLRHSHWHKELAKEDAYLSRDDISIILRRVHEDRRNVLAALIASFPSAEK